MKKELRKQYLALRLKKPETNLLEISKKIIDNLFTVPEFLCAETIMVYVSFRSEVDTLPLIKKLLEQKRRVCVPLCNSYDCSMTAREITEFSDLYSGSYGILEPKETAPVVSKNEIDFIIVPGCAFSLDGHRIGYGKGYYDRFLRGTDAYTCGLCYDFCLLKTIPTEETDVALNMIITQNGIIKP
ncbi:MAG: 5-formyltetrahydrofolate cyclo-ligase [Ruminococcaceae bacterium]|nr:5-formyltetrahydrofolate cyclo-ligase [Oscillospiraceae bacterium]